MDQLDLTEFFQTKAGALDFTSRLSTISEQLYKSDFNLEKSLLQEFGIHKKETFLNILRNNNIDQESNTSLKKFITSLQEKASNLPVLSIKLAFEPKEQTLKAIAEWFIINAKKQVLLEISADPSLIAGADISYNGEFIGLSVKPRFEAILKDILASNHFAKEHEKSEILSPSTHHQTENFSLGR